MNSIDSMLEIAMRLMKNRKPHTIQNLAKDVFEIKGLKISEHLDLYSQFINDFMLCGYFICCGENKKGVKLWDIKSRQSHDLMEKDGACLDDPYGDDEDVINNELKDDLEYQAGTDFDPLVSETTDDEEEKEVEEKDDIEEALINEDKYNADEEEKEEDDDEDEETVYSEADDLDEDIFDDQDLDLDINTKKK